MSGQPPTDGTTRYPCAGRSAYDDPLVNLTFYQLTDRRVYLIGTDEAGYGPNLGPLVVTATVWRVANGLDHDGLANRLRDCVVSEAPSQDDSRLCIADSKSVYKPRGPLTHLERSSLVALGCTGSDLPARWSEVWSAFESARQLETNESSLSSAPWYAAYDERLPIDADAEDIVQTIAVMRESLRRADVDLRQIQSAVVPAAAFNQRLDEDENKSTCLSQVTLRLVASILHRLPTSRVIVCCDKHGGRNKYAPLLQRLFPETLVEVHGESRSLSRYRLGPAAGRVEFLFQAKGDQFSPPAALASMVSKYLRELAMRAFNAYWCDQLSDLKPTAGYPLDARRFRRQIADRQVQLGISDATLWRRR